MTKTKISRMPARSKATSKRTVVSEKTIKSSAARVTSQGTLVSAEIMYVQRQLGRSATQEEIDASVVAVRKMKWVDVMGGIE